MLLYHEGGWQDCVAHNEQTLNMAGPAQKAQNPKNALKNPEMHLQGSMLLAGHAGGEVVFWELRRTSWENVKSVKGGPKPFRYSQ